MRLTRLGSYLDVQYKSQEFKISLRSRDMAFAVNAFVGVRGITLKCGPYLSRCTTKTKSLRVGSSLLYLL